MKDSFGRLNPVLATIALGVVLLFSGCGGGGGGDSTGGGSGGPVSLAGNAVKGYLSGATVNFYVLSANGSKGSTLGTATTDAKGKFAVSLSPAPASAFLAETSGGSYIDEVTGATVTLGVSDQLCAVLPAGTTQATITPLTNMACVRARALAATGVPLDQAVASSNIGVAQQFNVADIIGTLPVAADNSADVATAVRDERIYAIVLAGIAQEAFTLGVRAVDLAAALAEDLSDGSLNGTKSGAPIIIPNSALTLSASAGTGALQTAINTFVASTNNKTQITAAAVASVAQPVGINTAGKLYTTTTVPPAWISGQSGSVTLTASGGTPPYLCSLKTGPLPAGLSLTNCVLSGTVPLLAPGTTMSISAPFTVTIADSAMPPTSVDQELHITIVAPKPIVTATPKSCVVSAPCPVSVAQASGGTPPYSFRSDSFLTGAPPLGTVVGLNGSLMGTPSQTGVYNFGVCAVDLVGSSACVQTTVTVNPASNVSITVTTAGTGSGTVAANPPGLSYPTGTVVTLTATANPGSIFAGWSGACSGTGSCVLTMNADKAVTATFTAQNYAGSFSGSGPIANVNDNCTFQVTLGGNISITLSTVSPVQGSANVDGGWSNVVTGGFCNATADTFSYTLPVTGTASNLSFSGGSFPAVSFQGVLSGNTITGTATFTYTNTTGSISSAVTLNKQP